MASWSGCHPFCSRAAQLWRGLFAPSSLFHWFALFLRYSACRFKYSSHDSRYAQCCACLASPCGEDLA